MVKFRVNIIEAVILLCGLFLILTDCSNAPISDLWDYDNVEVKPKPIYIPEPEYPYAAQVLGIEGTVITRCVVDIDSTIALVEICQSSGYSILDNAAIEAAWLALFEPGMSGGEPVRVWVSLPHCFQLTEE